MGFGAVSPRTAGANIIAGFEALSGLLGFAVATGTPVRTRGEALGLNPDPSEKALIAPYQDGWSFQFRMVNRRANTLIELAVTLMMMTVDRSNGGSRREFTILKLERERIKLIPLMWTVVHPIDQGEPALRQDRVPISRSPAS